MIDKVKFNIYRKEEARKIVDLWNEEVGFIFKLDLKLFNQNVDESKYTFYDGSFVVYDGAEVVGFIISKIYDGNKIIQKYMNKGWISLFYVKRKYRHNGIGNYLLENAESKLREAGVTSISVGSDLDNFFPGVPNDFDNLTDVFLRKRGYTVGYYTHDLTKKIDESCLVSSENSDDKLVIRFATIDDRAKLLSFMESNFYGRWYFECLQYFEENEISSEYLLAIIDDEIVGFMRVNPGLINRVSYNINWRNNFSKLIGFGPLGVNALLRKRGIATKLLLYAMEFAYKNYYTDALIDWTGLVTYYQKFGFQVWKCYAYAQKYL